MPLTILWLQAIKAVKKHFPDFLIVTDVCLCAYMSHGHCGIVEDQKINNDKTLPILCQDGPGACRSRG